MHFIIFSVFICFSCIIVKIIQKVFLSLHQYIILSDDTVQNILAPANHDAGRRLHTDLVCGQQGRRQWGSHWDRRMGHTQAPVPMTKG